MTTDNQYAITAYEDACTALAFARMHDWGKDAELGKALDGSYWLEGLTNGYTLKGEYFEELASVPATIKAIREFGGY